MLVTKAQNDKAGNLDFARKKDVLFKAGKRPSLPINAYVRQQAEWKAQQIREREAELLRQLDRIVEYRRVPRAKQAGSPLTPSKRRKEPQAAAGPDASGRFLALHRHQGQRGADHAVARDDGGQLLLAPAAWCPWAAWEARCSAGRRWNRARAPLTSFGTSTPNSASTPRGSVTVRER